MILDTQISYLYCKTAYATFHRIPLNFPNYIVGVKTSIDLKKLKNIMMKRLTSSRFDNKVVSLVSLAKANIS